jgi:hypothetical protein
VKAIVNALRTERKTIRRTLDKAHCLVDTTLNTPIIRLGDILLRSSDDAFLREAARLDSCNGWR